MYEYKFENNAKISGELAVGGMVLLENKNRALPLENQVKVAVFGAGQLDFSMGGKGSARVVAPYFIDAMQGLAEAEKKGKLILDKELINAYRQDRNFEETTEFIAQAAERNSIALVILSRDAGEGKDRRPETGDYYLTFEEERLIRRLGLSKFQQVVVVVNSGGLIDLSWFKKYDNFSGLLLTWQPGMHGGLALANVLTGETNPSGHLTDTIAGDIYDYPSTAGFSEYLTRTEYTEDIFVGYRYFETLPGAKSKVLYPFGYGLSYTEFQLSDAELFFDEKEFTVTAKVTNIGERAGRYVAQLYTSAPAGNLDYPARELRDFVKTQLLQPGESEELKLTLKEADLRFFDEFGDTGAPVGSFVREQGIYNFYLGSDVRSAAEIGCFEETDLRIFSTSGILLQGSMLRKKLQADGTYENISSEVPCENLPDEPAFKGTLPRKMLLKDVASGNCSMDEFLSQLSEDELLCLGYGQPGLFATGTGGFGNLRKFGIHNPQTADGPAGLRMAVPTTCFPCATLVACSWDKELQFNMGKALGEEGLASNVDILLAPGLNIHRNPLCGRNFEYFSEDPLIAGRAAANLVRGVQSTGLGATIKHFALNNREDNRKFNDSVVSERALREIYLRAFEIAVKCGKPWCIMSSYNIINGVKVASNYNLLTRILRGEWGFDGLVMTDWINYADFTMELLAGNNLKMPYMEPFEMATAKLLNSQYRLLSRRLLERNAAAILGVVMRTNRFKNDDFGKIYNIKRENIRLLATEMTAVLNGRSRYAECKDTTGGMCHIRICDGYSRSFPQQLIYFLNTDCAGRWRASFRLATASTDAVLTLLVGKKEYGSFKIVPGNPPRTEADIAADPFGKNIQNWSTQGDIEFELPAGECELVVQVAEAWRIGAGVNMNYIDLTPVE